MALLTADVGGTNARFLLWINDGTVQLRFRKTYRPSDYPSLISVVRTFIEESGTPSTSIARAVLGVCGPTWDDGTKNESNNIPRWCNPGKAVSFHDAATFESELQLSAGSLRFANDFEAIGLAIAALIDSTTPHAALVTPPRVIYTAPAVPSAPACAIGAGTGLGACMVVPTGGTGEAVRGQPRHRVFPSEMGMADIISPRNELEWRFLQFLRTKHGGPFVEVEHIVAGQGIVDGLEFLMQDRDSQGK